MPRPVLPAILLAVLAAAGAAGCESASNAITTPSGMGTATVSGTIVDGGPSVISGGSIGAIVQQAGSNFSTTVDANQSFVLAQVRPSSNVILEFTGTGLNSQVAIGAVANRDTIMLSLVRTANRLDLDHSGRLGPGGTDIEGRIDSISALSGTFTVVGTTVQTDASTTFTAFDGSTASFLDLGVGRDVAVSGTASAPGLMLAKTVQFTAPSTNGTVTFEGAISNFEGSSLNFSFTLDGTVVHGDSSTDFTGGASFATLANGTIVGVTGVVNRLGFVQATSISPQVFSPARARVRRASISHSSTSVGVMGPWQQ